VSVHYRVKRRCSELLHYAGLLSAENFITTSLAHNKLKCASFSRISSLYKSLLHNYQCSKCAPLTWTQALRRRRHWLIAASTIDWSNCTHSSIRRVLSSPTSAIFLSAIFSVGYLIPQKLLGHVAPSAGSALTQIGEVENKVLWARLTRGLANFD